MFTLPSQPEVVFVVIVIVDWMELRGIAAAVVGRLPRETWELLSRVLDAVSSFFEALNGLVTKTKT